LLVYHIFEFFGLTGEILYVCLSSATMMGDLNCYFHKDRIAVSKCETCGKYICLECKHESKDNSYSDSSNHYICPYCYANEIETDDSSIVVVFGCLGFVVVISIFIAFTASMGGGFFSDFGSDIEPHGIVITVIIIVMIFAIGIAIYAVFKKETQPNTQAEEIRAKAKKTIEETTKKIQSSKSESVSHEALFCRFCGAPISEYAKTCEYCGMQWQWK